jgi:hypothetical protein
MWERKPRKTPQKISRLLMGPEQVMRSKTLQAIFWSWWWWYVATSVIWPREFLLWNQTLAVNEFSPIYTFKPKFVKLISETTFNLTPHDPCMYTFLIQQCNLSTCDGVDQIWSTQAVNMVNKLSQTALSALGCGGFTVKVGLDGL